MGTLKPQRNAPLYSNTVIGTLAVDGWAVTFGTARRGMGGLSPIQAPLHCTKCNSTPINCQCTNFVLSDVALQLPLHYKGLKYELTDRKILRIYASKTKEIK